MSESTAAPTPMMPCPNCKDMRPGCPGALKCKRCKASGEIPDIYKMGPELKDDGTYCAPWCGRGCTHEEYKQAQRSGAILAMLLGEGWTSYVSENLGWHYRAISPCGRLKVHENKFSGETHSYTAFLGEPALGGGKWAEHGDTPQEAVKAVVKVATAEVVKVASIIDGLDWWLR